MGVFKISGALTDKDILLILNELQKIRNKMEAVESLVSRLLVECQLTRLQLPM